ncbi:MAG: hypothetical protein ACE37J_21765 [Pikeienuella sp.]|uniref:hypothetical protein n=1 Tax=Pikeienuella sp. TaxID=2831957 RepID=UPI00391B2574
MTARNLVALASILSLLGWSAEADDGPLRIGPQDAPQSVRPDVREGPGSLRLCGEEETVGDGCVVRRPGQMLEDRLPSEGRLLVDPRRRAVSGSGDGSRSVSVQGLGGRDPFFAVQTFGAPTEVGILADLAGSGRVSLRGGRSSVGDGTDPSLPPPGVPDPSSASRDLFNAGRNNLPSLAVDVTLSPSGSLSVSQ